MQGATPNQCRSRVDMMVPANSIARHQRPDFASATYVRFSAYGQLVCMPPGRIGNQGWAMERRISSVKSALKRLKYTRRSENPSGSENGLRSLRVGCKGESCQQNGCSDIRTTSAADPPFRSRPRLTGPVCRPVLASAPAAPWVRPFCFWTGLLT
jgi:hypothetical protein